MTRGQRLFRFVVFFLTYSQTWTGQVIAASHPPPLSAVAASPADGLDSLDAWLQMTGLLVLMLGLFVLGAWMVKRYNLLPQLRGQGNGLKVLETHSLGFRNSLMVVGYGDRRFLLGVNGQGINLVSHLPDAQLPVKNKEQSPHTKNRLDSPFFERLKSVQEGQA